MLEQLISTPRLVDVDCVDLAAPPERVWQLVRHGDLARSPLVHALFELRALPARLLGKHEPSSLHVDDLRSTPDRPGFQLLLEDAPRCFAVGAIGKVWHGDIPFTHVACAEDYAAFSEPDFVKVAWSIRLLPLGEQDTRLELEVRVDATDDGAWSKFERYFRLIGPGSHFIRRTLLSGLAKELGTPRDAEQTRRLGFYSYQWLENIAGCGLRNADTVHQEWELEQGDELRLHPKVPPLRIVRLERGQFFVAHAPVDEVARAKGQPWATASWLFAVEPLPNGRCRLLTRYRLACSSDVATRLALGPTLLEPIGFAMDRRMLLGVKERAEREARYALRKMTKVAR